MINIKGKKQVKPISDEYKVDTYFKIHELRHFSFFYYFEERFVVFKEFLSMRDQFAFYSSIKIKVI